VGLVGQAQGGVLGMKNPHSFTHLVDGASVSGKYLSVHSIPEKSCVEHIQRPLVNRDPFPAAG